ncbi:serine hydrolase [Burkholderia thailandensis]|uniref:serine hydrolase n=1 Tax=Burkholderia thailandensis TaxID=57975 RepID=UPI00059D5954|nr:serine hydrolase [Burkholderia thailandensis]AVR06462.1 serine hydrolase [Burkholderia thailandensis]MCS6505002.1 serine hydrolase [Burkholderia thailandensis]MCS6513099.1 serine hydrolase [Burkholderia thailandensis]MCS6518550.1 serine hydrolase [Burkholderia thailandensis]NBD02405.1 serine hydrolase [Burkholderia thailandensis]
MESAQSLRLRRVAALSGALTFILASAGAHAGAGRPLAPPSAAVAIGAAIDAEIADGHIAGAVVVTGDAGGVRERVARGARVTGPAAEPMTADTVFDLASLTKAVATATAVMQLAERGRLALDAPAARYWPAFAARGKAGVTIRQLLAHTSGLPPGVSSARALRGRAAVLADVARMPPVAPPGTRVIYSDVNYVALGVIVERVTGRPLDAWCAKHVFTPLHMANATFRPRAATLSRIAPTVVRDGRLLRGRVHDPIAAAMGGVAGNAGLFASAGDLARFAQMLLNDGRLGASRVLSRASVAALETPATLDAKGDARTAGWDLQPPLVANRYRLPPAGLLQHLGYTGTGLWIDLVTHRFVIVLTSRLYPDERGDAAPLREQVLGLVASRSPPVSADQIAERAPTMAAAIARAARAPESAGPVLAGIDALESSGFAAVAGKRIALVTNRSGVDRLGRRTIDLLAHAPGARLVAIFAPEHGLGTDVDAPFGDAIDADTNVVVHSLYGSRRRIAPEALSNVDVLVFDIQDAGVRFFTYLATLGYVLEAAAAAHVPVVVLDRPNPLGGDVVGGPVSDADIGSFTNYYPLPLAPGMTIGELAKLFDDRLRIGADLVVVPMENYRRWMRYGDTGLGGLPPSPNLRDAAALSLYPDIGLVEGADVSVGRGTATPFGVLGAPWIDGRALADDLRAMHLSATFTPARFVPTEGPYRGALCEGVRIERLPGPVRPGRIGLAVALALHRRYPDRFRIDAIRASVGSRAVADMLADGRPLDEIEQVVDTQNAAFSRERAAYLLY